MTDISSSSPAACRSPQRIRASVLIVTLIFASLISVSLVSYIKLCTNSLKLAHRTMFATSASNLVEAGVEEAVWAFNQMGLGNVDAWQGWTTDSTKTAAVVITNGGSGYTSAPSVTISGGGGTGATATAILSGSKVSLIKITNSGSGFTSAPAVTFSGGGGSGAVAVATNMAATRTLATFNLDQSATGVVKVFVAGYDGAISSPLVVAQATVTPFDNNAAITRLIEVTLRFNGPFVNGVVAKNGLNWNGSPTADSWISNASGSATGPWVSYSTAVARAHNTVADLTGSVDLSANGVVNGDLKMGASVTKTTKGSVTGSTTNDFNYQFTMPPYPTAAGLDHYYNLGAVVPASLPQSLDNKNTSDGRYYYFTSAGAFPSTTTITAGRNVTIVGSNGTNVTGTVNVPSDGSLYIYTDGTVNATYVNNAWAGALQIYTSTTSDTTLNGNDNVKACIYAPNSTIKGNGGGNSGAFYGSFVGANVTSDGHMDFHYDESLGKISNSKPWVLTIWRELQTATERNAYSTQLNF